MRVLLKCNVGRCVQYGIADSQIDMSVIAVRQDDSINNLAEFKRSGTVLESQSPVEVAIICCNGPRHDHIAIPGLQVLSPGNNLSSLHHDYRLSP